MPIASAGHRGNDMKIAVTYENGEVFQHFGHTEQFKIYNIENGKITESQVIGNGGFGHGSLAGYLKDMGVEALICGGIGDGARNMLKSNGIDVFTGNSGNVDDVAKAFIEGKLVRSDRSTCKDNHDCHCH